MKRGKISLGSPLVFRISKPGFDVDTAAQADLLIHESVFLSQIIESGTIANPGSPYTVDIAFDASLINPIPIVYPVYGGNKAFPAPMAYLSGLPAIPYTNVIWNVPSAGILRINFTPIVPSAAYAIIRQEAP